MSYIKKYYIFIILSVILEISFCFIALPFNTIFIKNDTVSPKNDYRVQMLQNEIYVNFSAGTPMQNIVFILKMDLYGFLLYNGSFNKNLSKTYEYIDNERKLNNILQINSITAKDYFYLPSYNSYNDFNNNKKNNLKSKAEFLWLQKVKGSITKFNDVYENYGIIGLQINYYTKYYVAPELVTAFNEIKKHSFYLKYDDNKINGFFNSNNTGYFIIGEELTDNPNEKKNIKYTHARERLDQVSWDLAFDDIVSKSKENETIVYNPEYKHAELYVNYPYIFGPRDYHTFIRKVFFQDLYMKRICDYSDTLNEGEYIGYKCDTKSEIFMEKLNNFPDLVFEHEELEEKFIFKGKDLFTYNIYNKSDTYVYFVILFPLLKDKYHPMSWILGAPFLKKYSLSFNYDNKMIGYLKKNNNPTENSLFSISKKEVLLITIFIFSIILAFVLGMYTHKKIAKAPRKTKANELDDNCEYIENKDKNKDIDINDSNNDIQLGNKLIN